MMDEGARVKAEGPIKEGKHTGAGQEMRNALARIYTRLDSMEQKMDKILGKKEEPTLMNAIFHTIKKKQSHLSDVEVQDIVNELVGLNS